MIVRENSEGEYAGHGGRSHRGHPQEVGTEVVDLHPRRRRAHHALRIQARQSRPRKQLTVVTKSNAQRNGMVMWDEIAAQVAKRIPRREMGQDAGRRDDDADGAKPESLDTIVATNLHADIISDLAAALAGSLGIAPTANLNPDRKIAVDVRADPWLGIRHHGQGHCQPDRDVLDGRDDARAPGREDVRPTSS